eukprot:6457749-Amphidinium_carterae.2
MECVFVLCTAFVAMVLGKERRAHGQAPPTGYQQALVNHCIFTADHQRMTSARQTNVTQIEGFLDSRNLNSSLPAPVTTRVLVD